MIVIRILDYKAPNILGVCWKQPVQRPCCSLKRGNCDNYFVAWWFRDFIPHSQNLWRSKRHPSLTNVTNRSLFSMPLDEATEKNPPLRLPYDWGRIGLQPFLCATARHKSKMWILMAIFRQSLHGQSQILHQQQVQGAVQSITVTVSKESGLHLSSLRLTFRWRCF